VPQPTAPPCAPVQINKEINYTDANMKFFETAKNERKSYDVKKQKSGKGKSR
jgi:hypothetical protein